MLLGIAGNNELFTDTTGSYLSSITRNFLNTGQDDSAIARINSLARNTNNLSSCISAILSLLSFLGHNSEEVRNAATEVLISLLGKAAFFLSSEKNPEKILKSIPVLLEAIEKIQNAIAKGFVKISPSSFSKLLDILKSIEKIMYRTINHLISKNNRLLSDYPYSDSFTNSNRGTGLELISKI